MNLEMKKTEDKQWDEVMNLARKYNLIVQAYGGIAILFHPEIQRQRKIHGKVMKMNFNGEEG